MRLSAGWRAQQWQGLEHMVLCAGPDGWHVRGTLVTAGQALTSVLDDNGLVVDYPGVWQRIAGPL